MAAAVVVVGAAAVVVVAAVAAAVVAAAAAWLVIGNLGTHDSTNCIPFFRMPRKTFPDSP